MREFVRMDTKAFCGALAGLMLMSWLLRAKGEAASMPKEAR